jgi:GlpG protein
MRLIGHLGDEASARTFADFLYVQGIENRLENQNKDGWAIWVVEEDRIDQATTLLTDFQKTPGDPKYRAGAKDAAQRRSDEEKDKAEYRKRVVGRERLFRTFATYGVGPLTMILIVASTVVFVLSKFGQNIEGVEALLLWLPAVRAGEVWRLVTPIFVHGDVLHIFFNMWWLWDLGSMIEGRQSTWHLAALVLVIAICSNLAQYPFAGPNFFGMSGVVYGLFGYIWIRGKCDPVSGLFLHPTTVTMMIVWFFLCLVGVIGNVANWTHACGLGLGMAWGYLSSLRYR